MSSHRLILKGGATLGLGQLAAQVCSFVRNIMVARLISPSDFGIAATFAVTVSVFEMMSNLSANMLLIQAKDGDDPLLQKTAHLINAGRGLMNAAIVFLVGRPFAQLFGEPQARWAFELLALVPLLKGLLHLDASRLQREMHFGPAVTVDVGSQLLVTAAALPLAYWLRDFSAMLWVLILQAASATLISHIVAIRPYRWTWQKAYARRIGSFGWPLLVNGLLLFVIMDGDRFVIGSAHRVFHASPLTLSDLGVYSVAFALTQGPATLMTNVGNSMFLPLLARAQGLQRQFERRYRACVQFFTVIAAGAAIPFVMMGGWLVVKVYGTKYGAATDLIPWLAAMWGLRVVRAAPTMAALALGDTRNSMYSNIARTVALAGVLTAVALGAGLVWVAVAGCAGEAFALFVCVVRLHDKHGIHTSSFTKPFAVCAGSVSLAVVAAAWGVESLGTAASITATLALVALVWVAMLHSFPGFRADVEGLVFKSGLLVEKSARVT